MKDRIKYAKEHLSTRLLNEVDDVKQVFDHNDKLYIEFANGMNVQLHDDEIDYQVANHLESNIQMSISKFNFKNKLCNWNEVHKAIDLIHSLYDDDDFPKYNMTIDANQAVIFDCRNYLELVVNKDGATQLEMAQIAIDEFITKHEPNLLVGMHKPQYEILIAPHSEDEDKFYDCVTYEDALKVMPDCETASVHSFETPDERDAFLEGYEAAIGNLGDGYFITNSK